MEWEKRGNRNHPRSEGIEGWEKTPKTNPKKKRKNLAGAFGAGLAGGLLMAGHGSSSPPPPAHCHCPRRMQR